MLVLTRETSEGIQFGKNLLLEVILINSNHVEFKVTQGVNHHSIHTLEVGEKLALNAETELSSLRIYNEKIRIGIESDESITRVELL